MFRSPLETLWRRGDIALRDKAFWRLAYDAAARAGELLGLDLAGLDLDTKTAVVAGKGGIPRQVNWYTHTARLLARLAARPDSPERPGAGVNELTDVRAAGTAGPPRWPTSPSRVARPRCIVTAQSGIRRIGRAGGPGSGSTREPATGR
jgi:integrase